MKNLAKVGILSTVTVLCGSSAAHESYKIINWDSPHQVQQIKSDDSDLVSAHKALFDASRVAREQYAKKGYVETDGGHVIKLLELKHKKSPGFVDDKSDPHYETLRESSDDIKLTFRFEGLTGVRHDDLLGYAPSGTNKNGSWTGITGYFKHADFGLCGIQIIDMEGTGGTAYFNKKYVTFDVNDKPTTKRVAGAAGVGFEYEVMWVGQRYQKELFCANDKSFDSGMLKRLSEYAKLLDKDLPDDR